MSASPSALLLSSSKSWRGGCRRAGRARDMEHCVKCQPYLGVASSGTCSSSSCQQDEPQGKDLL